MKKQKDPRKIPLNHCATIGELMMHIAECKELDKKDQQKKFNLTKEDMEIE